MRANNYHKNYLKKFKNIDEQLIEIKKDLQELKQQKVEVHNSTNGEKSI
jgi:hypothetical protein